MLKVKCSYCGNDVEKTNYQLRRSKNHYCNTKCQHEHAKTTKEQKREVQRKYREQNKEYYKEYNKKYKKEYSKTDRKRLSDNKTAKNKRTKRYKELMDLGLLTDCIICGFPKEKVAAIAFHHKNPEEKEELISKLIRTTSKEKLIKEVEKCVCLCFNCHQLYHCGDEETINKYNEVTKNEQKT